MPDQSNDDQSASGRLSALLIDASPTPEGRARISSALNMLSDVSSAPNDIDHAVQTLGAHIRRLSDQQRQELTNLYQQAQSDILRRIEDDGQVDESTRFRLRNARLIMQRGEIIPQEPRQEPAIMEPIRQAPPNPSPPQGTLPNVVIAAASVVKGGDEVTTVSAPVFPPGLGTSRHVQ